MEEKIKEKSKVLWFILNTLKCIAWAILIILVIFALFLVYYVFLTKRAEKQGLQFKPPMALYTIISPSMQPNINVYDVVLSIKEEPNKLAKGDIITFYSSDENLDGITVTHRIIQVNKTNNGYQFKTKGDNNVEADASMVLEKDIIGKVRLKVPQLGKIQFFLSSKGGWFIIILIPALFVISYDMVKLVRVFKLKKKVKKNREELDKNSINNDSNNQNNNNLS